MLRSLEAIADEGDVAMRAREGLSRCDTAPFAGGIRWSRHRDTPCARQARVRRRISRITRRPQGRRLVRNPVTARAALSCLRGNLATTHPPATPVPLAFQSKVKEMHESS